MQKPSKGRIVMFYSTANADDARPAVITKVHSDECVNLHVFWDAGDGFQGDKVTSVTIAPTVDGVTTPKPYSWTWPTKV